MQRGKPDPRNEGHAQIIFIRVRIFAPAKQLSKESMKLSPKAQNIYKQISSKTTKLGDIRNIAKGIKKDHELVMELWPPRVK